MVDLAVIQAVKHHVVKGDWTLSSGRKSDWKFVIEYAFRETGLLFSHMINMGLHEDIPMVGIWSGGAYFVRRNVPLGHGIVDVRTGLLLMDPGYYPVTRVHIVDDVVTTESSMKRAAEILERQGYKVDGYFAILDRRRPEDRTLEVNSLVTAADLGLEP